jgi:serine/threonine protein kinase
LHWITSIPNVALYIQVQSLLESASILTNKSVDIKADNILIEIEDKGILDAFVDAELNSPSSRKVVNDTPVYATRQFGLPKAYGKVVLGDFGSAVRGTTQQVHDAQPDVYRCPEVMLKTEWNYPADIWNVGAMVIHSQCFDLGESRLPYTDLGSV